MGTTPSDNITILGTLLGVLGLAFSCSTGRLRCALRGHNLVHLVDGSAVCRCCYTTTR